VGGRLFPLRPPVGYPALVHDLARGVSDHDRRGLWEADRRSRTAGRPPMGQRWRPLLFAEFAHRGVSDQLAQMAHSGGDVDRGLPHAGTTAMGGTVRLRGLRPVVAAGDQADAFRLSARRRSAATARCQHPAAASRVSPSRSGCDVCRRRMGDAGGETFVRLMVAPNGPVRRKRRHDVRIGDDRGTHRLRDVVHRRTVDGIPQVAQLLAAPACSPASGADVRTWYFRTHASGLRLGRG
jgi:hypothetical protein